MCLGWDSLTLLADTQGVDFIGFRGLTISGRGKDALKPDAPESLRSSSRNECGDAASSTQVRARLTALQKEGEGRGGVGRGRGGGGEGEGEGGGGGSLKLSVGH